MGTLFVVGTPIGNLKDVTHRALEALQQADYVLAEDTRVTAKLFSHYGIETPLISYHQHSKGRVQEKVLELLSEGKNLALVTDAGTPGISDPGNALIGYLLSNNPTLNIVPVPGPSALTALASIAGIAMDSFLFVGYPPSKRARKKFFEQVASSPYPVIFYESPYRIQKSLEELREASPDCSVVVAKELTKVFETVWRGTIEEVIKTMQNNKHQGEFAVLTQPS